MHGRLNHVARDFLGQELKLVPPANPATATIEKVTRFALAGGGGEQGQAVWLSVTDFVLELGQGSGTRGEGSEIIDEELAEEGPSPEDMRLEALDGKAAEDGVGRDLYEDAVITDVLDSDEREALAASLGDLTEARQAAAERMGKDSGIEAYGAQAETVVVPVRPAGNAPFKFRFKCPFQYQFKCRLETSVQATVDAPAAAPTMAGVGLRAVDAPQGEMDGATLWRLVRESLEPMQRGMTVLEARPPQEDFAQLTVDGGVRGGGVFMCGCWRMRSGSRPGRGYASGRRPIGG